MYVNLFRPYKFAQLRKGHILSLSGCVCYMVRSIGSICTCHGRCSCRHILQVRDMTWMLLRNLLHFVVHASPILSQRQSDGDGTLAFATPHMTSLEYCTLDMFQQCRACRRNVFHLTITECKQPFPYFVYVL